MSASITFFRSVCSTNFINSLKNWNHHLFIKLWTLSQVCFTIKIIYFKYFRSSFSWESNYFWSIDLCEVIIFKKSSHILFNYSSYLEYIHLPWMPQSNYFIFQ